MDAPPTAGSAPATHGGGASAPPASGEAATDASVRAGNDSSDTVMPPRPSVPLPSYTPGQLTLDSLRRLYASNAQPVDLGEEGIPGLIEGTSRTSEWSETIQNLATRVGQFTPMSSYYEFIGSRCVFNLGVVGQFESALNSLSSTVEQAYAQLNIPSNKRVLEPQWQDPLLVVANSDFAHVGEASRAFKFLAAWVRHAQSHLEVILGLCNADDYVPPPRPLNLSLRGHFNAFAETTMRGLRAEIERAGTPTLLLAPLAGAQWTAKDTVALAKMINTPSKPREPALLEQEHVYSFAEELAARDGRRRKSHAIQPADFSSDDPMAGLASSLFKIQRPVPRASGEPLRDTVARARAQPAQLVPAHSMTAFIDPEVSADASQHSVTARPPPAQSLALAASTKADTSRKGAPEDDWSEDDPDPARPPPGGGGSGGDPYGDPANDRGYPGGGGGGGGYGGGGRHGGGGGGGPGGDPPYDFPAAAAAQFRQAGGLVLDMRIKINSLPTWDGNDRTALKYFSQLNEWARAGKTSELIHQLPHIAPLRFTGAVSTWWSNLSAQTRADLQKNFKSFIPGIRRLFLSDRWAEERRLEFVAMKFRQKYHEHKSPFDYVNRRILLARVLYDLSPEQLVTEVLANSPPQWAYILGKHSIRDTDELMTRVRQIGPSLVSSYLAGMEPDEEATMAKVDKLVMQRFESLLKQAGLQ